MLNVRTLAAKLMEILTEWKNNIQNQEKLNVWAWIIGDYKIEHFFMNMKIRIDNYLALLHNNGVPNFVNLYPAQANPNVLVNVICFQ